MGRRGREERKEIVREKYEVDRENILFLLFSSHCHITIITVSV